MFRVWLVVAIALTFHTAAWAQPAYRITKTVALGAPDRWDYIMFDAPSHRVYVAHGSLVSVVDGTDGKLIGTVGDFPGVTHGIGIARENGLGYTDDGKAGSAVSFDLKTLKTKRMIKTAPDADGIGFDPASGHIFVINGDSGSLTVIDPATDTAIAAIDAGGGLEFGEPDGKGKFYVDGAEKKELIRIDTATNTINARWSIPTCTSPHGLAVDAATHRVFVSCLNSVLLVVDAENGRVVATLPIGHHSDAVVFDPIRKLVFSSNGDGTLSIIREKDADTFVPLPTIATQKSARTMALDPATGRLYLAAIEVVKEDPPEVLGGRPHVTVAPGSLKLLFLDPVN